MTSKKKNIFVALVLIALGFVTYNSFAGNRACRAWGSCSPLGSLALLNLESGVQQVANRDDKQETPSKTAPTISNEKHRVVFEVTMGGEEQWTAVLNNVANVQQALGKEKTEIEVIAHGNGLGLLLKSNTALSDKLDPLAASGVVFAACENTMKKKNVRKDDLLPLATTVDSGVAEVVRKQEAGWSYVKSGI